MKLRSPSYLGKLMLFSILIGAIPVLLLGSFAYYNSSRTVQEKVNEGNKQLLLQTQMRVEQTLRTIDNSATQLLQSPLVTGSFDKEITKDDFEMVHELYKGISLIQTYELGIEDVFLLSLSRDWLVSSTGVNEYSSPSLKPRLEAFSRMAGGSFWIRGADGEEEAEGKVGGEGEGGTNGGEDSRSSVYFVKKYPFNAIRPKGIICVVLTSDTLKEFLESRSDKLGSAFTLDSDGRALVRGDSGPPTIDLPGQPYLRRMRDAAEAAGQYTAKLDGEAVTVTFRKSSYNGWSYVSVASNAQINAQNRIIGWLTLLVSLAILLVTLLVAWFGSKKMYRPIRSIYGALAGIPSAESGRRPSGELQVIGERVDYLIRNQSRIMNELKGQQIQLKEYFVHKLVEGAIRPAEFEDKLGLYGWDRPWPSMRLIAVQIDTLKNTNYEEKDRDLLLFAINNIVGELVQANRRLAPVVLSDVQATLIGSAEEEAEFKERIFELSGEIQKTVYQYLKIKASIGISRSFRSFADAPDALDEARGALKIRVGLGQESVLFAEDVQPQASHPYRFPYEEEQALFDAIRTGDEERSEQALRLFIRKLFEPESRHQDYQLSLLRLLIDFLRFGQERSVPMDGIAEDEASLVQSLLRLRDVREVEHWFSSKFVHPYLRELGDRLDGQFKMISEAVIGLIRREFDTGLTLESCSARINYHPHYVSRVFRKETGVNFGEYLTQYRIEMAKRWLKESDLKIGEIAERLQYNNAANFIRSFRKLVGITPGQYRENGSERHPV